MLQTNIYPFYPDQTNKFYEPYGTLTQKLTDSLTHLIYYFINEEHSIHSKATQLNIIP